MAKRVALLLALCFGVLGCSGGDAADREAAVNGPGYSESAGETSEGGAKPPAPTPGSGDQQEETATESS